MHERTEKELTFLLTVIPSSEPLESMVLPDGPPRACHSYQTCTQASHSRSSSWPHAQKHEPTRLVLRRNARTDYWIGGWCPKTSIQALLCDTGLIFTVATLNMTITTKTTFSQLRDKYGDSITGNHTWKTQEPVAITTLILALEFVYL